MSAQRVTARPGSPWRLPLRVLLTGLAMALMQTATPGPASAATSGSVTPFLDCYTTNGEGSWTAVFGYRNDSTTGVTVPIGPRNKVTPTAYGAPQPTEFAPGVHHGVFSLTVPRGAGPMWHLDHTNLAARKGNAPLCSSSTPLPGDGNGTGIAAGLAVAGVAGALVVRRLARRGAGKPAASVEALDA